MWRDALPPHAEVCDSAEGVQDDGHTCCAPRWLALQAFLANGKLKQTLELRYLWYKSEASVQHTFVIHFNLSSVIYCMTKRSSSTLRFQVLSYWWCCPVWGISCSTKGPTTSARFLAPYSLCCVIGGFWGLRASTPPWVLSSFRGFTYPRL